MLRAPAGRVRFSVRLRAAGLGYYFPLALLLGGVSLPVAGKEFYFPFYLPLLYLGLFGQRLAFRLRRVPRQDLLLAIYCCFALCSVVYAVDLPKYLYLAFTLFGLGIPAYVLGRRLGDSDSWSGGRFLRCLVWLGALLSGLYLLALARDPLGFRVAFLYKLTKVAGMRSNTLASVHIFGLVAALYALRCATTARARLGYGAVLVLDAVGGLAFNSRTYLPLMFLPVLVYLVRGRDRAVHYLRLAAVLCCLALVVHPPEALLQTLSQRWVTQAATPGGWRRDPRVQIWSRAVDLWLERPLLGHGLGNSFFGEQFLWQLVYGRATLEEIAAIPEEALTYRADGYFMAHDTVLQLLIEVGLFGAIAFFLVYVYFLRDLWRLRRVAARETAPVAAAILVAILIASLDGLVENNFLTRDFGTLYWFLVGLACSLSRREEAAAEMGQPVGGPPAGALEPARG